MSFKKQVCKLLLKIQFIVLIVTTTFSNAESTNETLVATFGDWMKVCNTIEMSCVGVSFAQNESGKKVGRFVLDLAKQQDPKIKAIGTLLIPYKTAIPHLPSGIIMKLDQQKPIQEQFFFCDKTGCSVKYRFAAAGLKLIKSGSNIFVKFKDVRDLKTIKTMDISLNGIGSILLAIE